MEHHFAGLARSFARDILNHRCHMRLKTMKLKKKTKDIRKHKRILDTFTGPVERPLLHWLAARQPAWVTPDMLTGVSIFGAVVIFIGFLLTNDSKNYLWLVTLGFVINWYGDSLDGTLARYRHIERPIYGFYIDHVADAFVEMLIFLGLGLSPYVRFDLACLALIGYFLLSVLVYVRTCVKGEFTISYGKLGPTEARLIAVSGNTLVYFFGAVTFPLFSLSLTIYDWIAIGVIILEMTISIVTAFRQASLLSKQDPGNKSSI
jgi:archaetidylinositol phosphate synthase